MSRSHPPRRGLTRRELLGRALGLAAGLRVLPACKLQRRTPGGPDGPLPATGSTDGNELKLGNAAVEGSWTVADGTLRALRFVDRPGGATLALPPSAFALTLADGSRLTSVDLKLLSGPNLGSLSPDPKATRASERAGGQQLTLELADPGGRVQATWRAILRDGSRYLRQELTLRAPGAPLSIRELALVELDAPGASVAGTIQGCPATWGNFFFGLEHPLSTSSADGGRLRCFLPRNLPLRPGTALTVSSVMGATRSGQLRRDFLAYLERERANPYRTFLHYNSWYDIGFFSQYGEPEALAVIDAYGAELQRKRGVVLSSFLFDDGWDDPDKPWSFHGGFPNGLTKVAADAAGYGAAPGLWLSPWGGYGPPQQQRVEHGRAQGFETNPSGLALSGPHYYASFRDTCLAMIRQYGLNQLKLDGISGAPSPLPDSLFDSDLEAVIHLIEELRAEKPDLYVNVTSGSSPSPFWLRHADSVWRGGEDHGFSGAGSDRQQWITYRDAQTFKNVVRGSPLYPLNSIMLHGIIYARHAERLATDPQQDFGAEVRSYFGTGTQLQELYVTPVLTAAGWDSIAEGANWSRRNAGTLVDTHWVGGDPGGLEPYGWASWSPALGILTLRNPGAQPQRIALDVEQALELPSGAARSYLGRSPWSSDSARPPLSLQAGQQHTFELQPFEVLTLELSPQAT